MINAVTGTPANTPTFQTGVGPQMPPPPAPIAVGGGLPQPTAPSIQPPSRKKEFPLKWVITGAFLLLLILGGGVALFLSNQNQDVRQQAYDDVVYPPPVEPPHDPPHDAAACAMSFTVSGEVEDVLNCTKVAFQDEFSHTAGNYTYTTEKIKFEPGDVIVFRVIVSYTGQESTAITLTDVLNNGGAIGSFPFSFMDSTCGTEAYNAQTKTLTCSLGQGTVIGFRVRISENATAGTTWTNIANVATNSNVSNVSATCQVAINIITPSVSPTPTASPPGLTCGGSCANTTQCPQNHTCDASKCVLTACVNGASCRADRCQTTGCGSTCTADTECPSAHSCNAGRCELTSCVNGSASCGANRCAPTTCGSTCTATTDCSSGNICDAGKCVLNACANGASCTSNRCQTTGCGSACTATSECPADNTCTGNVCVLNACANGASCTSNRCTVTTTTVTPPAIGCNQTCATNADCQSSNHICVDTDSGRRCRLESNINSTTCSTAVSEGTTIPANGQPDQPETLPVAGSADIMRAFLIGLFAVVLGVVGLLLL